MNNLFTIIFDDNSKYDGGTLEKTGWKDIPSDKKIRSIFYSLPSGDMLAIANYNEYYQFIEVTQNIYGSKVQNKIFRYCYLLGKKDTEIICYKIHLQNNLVEILYYSNDDEFIKKLNPIFWKKGR